MPTPRSPTQRSRLTKGSALLPGIDGRRAWVRRCRDLIELHTADLGGEDRVSEAEHSMVRRAEVIETELEILEATFATAGGATGEALDLYGRTAGNLRRLPEAVSLARRQRDVTPELGCYLAMRAAEAPVAVPIVTLPPPPPAPEVTL
jgi:hypothetical protein